MSEDIFTRILKKTATETHKCNFYQTREENNDLRDVFSHPKNLCAVSYCSTAKSDMLQHDRFEVTDTGTKFNIRTFSAVSRIYATHDDGQINLFHNYKINTRKEVCDIVYIF